MICGTPEDPKNEIHGVTWGYLDGGSKEQVNNTLDGLRSVMQTYPDLRESEYKQWSELCKQYLLPIAE
eukprot:15444438-Alexandrium_andersonii.AAC.1